MKAFTTIEELTVNKDYNRYIFEKGVLKAALFMKPKKHDHSKIYKKPLYHTHLEFYALSAGWNEYTSTGYSSHFFPHDDSYDFERQNVVFEYFESILESVNFVMPVAIQESLF